MLAISSPITWAQNGIFSCVDAKGRKVTSDRPIPECAEREQRELNRDGTTRRTLKPAPTAKEKEALEERQKLEAENRERQAEAKRKDRTTLQRYPNQAAHDTVRNAALAQADENIKWANTKIKDLGVTRKTINEELEFYKKDPKKIPGSLKRQIDENDSNVDIQNRFIAEKLLEKARINARFDEELARLKTLWAQTASAQTTSP